ncbi:hypothetical protein TKK_0003288 [Trichogramma kaykai]
MRPPSSTAQKSSGDVPLHLALKYGQQELVVELFLKKGANPNLANRQGLTPLHIICLRPTTGLYGTAAAQWEETGENDVTQEVKNFMSKDRRPVRVKNLPKRLIIDL